MSLYPHALVPVSAALEDLHREELEHLAHPGTWLSAEERLATVAAARGGAAAADLLPAESLRLIDLVARAPRLLRREDCTRALADGMSAGEYVETVSLVSRIVNLDVFARGVGAAPLDLPPAVAGEPSQETPAASDEGAWLPSVPAGAAARAVYGDDGPQPFIYRALSLVPNEVRRCIAGGNVQYLPLARFMDFGYSHQPGLSRVQVEIVAARISALNDCFY